MTFAGKGSNNQRIPNPKDFRERFTDFEILGEGGMGTVYKANDTILQKKVAIKLLKVDHVKSGKHIARLQKEAKALAKLNHHAITTILDFGLTEKEEPYLIMEYLDGYSFEEYLEKRGKLSLEEAFPIFEQIAQALQYSHGKGIIHRDLKPSNILLIKSDTNSPSIKIIDFGISTILESDQGQTTSGTMLGSPAYMSPEQTESTKVDERSDIYSLGCIIFRTLTGTIPISGQTANQTILLKRTTTAPTLSKAEKNLSFPAELENLVERCLEKDPSKRYSTIEEFQTQLKASVEASPEPLPEKLPGEKSGKANLSPIYVIPALALIAVLISLQFREAKVEDKTKAVKEEVEIETLGATASKAKMESFIFAKEPSAKRVKDIRNIEWLELEGAITGDFIRKQKNANYIHLRHLSGKITDDIVEALVEKNPKGLNLKKTGLNDKQFEMLTKLTGLEYLSIAGCTEVTGVGIRKVGKLKSLEFFQFSGKKLTKEDMKFLARHPKIRHLSFFGQSKFRKNAFEGLKRKESYHSIAVTGASLKPKDIKQLALELNVNRLSFFNLSLNELQLDILSKTKANYLTISGCFLQPKAIRKLAKNNSLEGMLLTKNTNLTDEDIKYLRQIMGAHCKIKYLPMI